MQRSQVSARGIEHAIESGKERPPRLPCVIFEFSSLPSHHAIRSSSSHSTRTLLSPACPDRSNQYRMLGPAKKAGSRLLLIESSKEHIVFSFLSCSTCSTIQMPIYANVLSEARRFRLSARTTVSCYFLECYLCNWLKYMAIARLKQKCLAAGDEGQGTLCDPSNRDKALHATPRLALCFAGMLFISRLYPQTILAAWPSLPEPDSPILRPAGSQFAIGGVAYGVRWTVMPLVQLTLFT